MSRMMRPWGQWAPGALGVAPVVLAVLAVACSGSGSVGADVDDDAFDQAPGDAMPTDGDAAPDDADADLGAGDADPGDGTPASPLWDQRAGLPEALTGVPPYIGFAVGPKGYVLFHHGTSIEPGALWEYDPAGNTWTKKGDHPGVTFQSPMFVIAAKAYFASGNVLWEYDPASDAWTQRAVSPGPDKRAGFGFAVGGRGYVGGGFYNGRRFWEYEPALDDWVEKSSHPALQSVPGNDPAVDNIEGISFTIGTKAYVTGTNMNFWEYDPADDAWTQRTWVNAVYAQAFAVGGRGHVLNAFGELFRYDPVANAWDDVGDYPGAAVCYVSGFVAGDRAYLGLGRAFANNTCGLTTVNELWRLTP